MCEMSAFIYATTMCCFKCIQSGWLCDRDRLWWLRRWWKLGRNFELSGSQICAFHGAIWWGLQWARLDSGASLQGWRGSYEVWVMPSNWLLEQTMKLAGQGLAGWVRWWRVNIRGTVWVGGGGAWMQSVVGWASPVRRCILCLGRGDI